MKRLGLIILCFSILLSGCLNKKIDEDLASLPNSEENALKDPTLQMIQDWPDIQISYHKKTNLLIPQYETKVKPYTIAKDFSNVVNMDQFSGFTQEQLKMLQENGFVVLPSKDTKMFYVYDHNEYAGVPNFITVDSVLHMYHQFYDKTLMYLESKHLAKDLNLLTEQMLNKSIMVYDALKDEDLKKIQEKNIIYFMVARMLIEPDAKLETNINHSLIKIAEQELELIEQAASYEKSPLFLIDLDYSQFTVRGHYTRSEELSRYFRTMMWLGTAPLSFYDYKNEPIYENILQALLMTFTTFVSSEEKSDVELWANIYVPTSHYIGVSDDVHLYLMNKVRLSVFGDSNDPNIFNDRGYYEKLVEAVNALPEPKISGKLSSVSTPTGKQFRFMGQRYILDSFIMQELMAPVVRPVPTSLDVMGILGSKLAEDLLFNVLKPQESWPDYEAIYQELKGEVTGYTEELWGVNLYNGWLWAIQEALREYTVDSGMPLFMTNDAWKHKSLNAALGSYTELKHDNVLYGKQPVAQMGGPIEFAKQHYVEPNIPLYSKLHYLTDYTISVLEEHGMLNEELLHGANEYKQLLEFLIQCSIKQLRNEPLSEEENTRLLRYGGTLEYIALSYQFGLTDDHSSFDISESEMLVTDVATIAPSSDSQGAYLSLGTGYFDHIYVIVSVDGKLLLSRGSVYSHYEFLSDKRLTDEEWWAFHGLHKVEEEYGSFFEWREPSADLPQQPFWVNKFKLNVNDVVIEPLEVDWEKIKD